MTDPRPTPAARRGPRWNPEPRTLQLWVVTALSTGYLVAWWSFAPAPGSAASQEAEPRASVGDAVLLTASAPQQRWWHELPPAERPQVVLPAGWELATPGARRAAPVAQPALRLVSTSRPARRTRVRTRSS